MHCTAQKLKLRIFTVNVPKSDFVTFTEEILNGKLNFLCNVCRPVSLIRSSLSQIIDALKNFPNFTEKQLC